MFYKGTNDQMTQPGVGGVVEKQLMVKRFQRSSQVSFPLIGSGLGYSYIISNVNTTNIGMNLKNTFSTKCLWGWVFHVKSVFIFKKLLGVISSLASW